MAKSVCPVRHARPMVSVITTPTVTPRRSRNPSRSVAALRSGSTGSSASSVDPTLEPSTPAAAWTSPIAFSVIRVRPLRASTRTASSSMSLRRRVSRSSGSDGAATMRPSHLETTLLVTTRTSPSRSHGAASASEPTRSSPGRNSGRPGTGRISTRSAAPCSAFAAALTATPRRGPDRRGPSPRWPRDRSSAAAPP